MQAIFNLCSTVAANAVPPSSIATDATVAAYYSTAPAQTYNPQFFLAVTDVAGIKQEPRYIGAGRDEMFSVSGVIWGGVGDPSSANMEALTTFLASLLTSLDSSVISDPTLGGIAIQSWLESYELSFGVEAQGKAAQIDFEIHVEAIVN